MMKRNAWIGTLLVVALVVAGGWYGLSAAKRFGASSLGPTETYTYLPHGYSMQYPANMQVDDSLAAVRTRFTNEQTQIDVYYDNFNNTVTAADSYIGYGNRFAANTTAHQVTEDSTVTINGYQVHLLKWQRQSLKHIPGDKPYYATAELVKNEREVYSVHMKSNQPIDKQLLDVVRSFRIVKQEGEAEMGRVGHKQPLRVNEETANVYRQLFDTDGLKWGLFDPASSISKMEHLQQLEEKLDYKFNVLIRYQSLDKPFPMKDMQAIYDEGRIAELTLQTMKYEEDNASIMYSMLQGAYDDYFRQYAKDIKAFGHPILFRLDNEMNGDWVPYSSYHTSKDTDIYIELWRYLHDLFREEGVDNVLWVWNPNNLSKPGFAWNHTVLYYPGDAYVDVVGLTAYNTGTYYEGEQWMSFQELYESLYASYAAWFEQPLLIAEYASSSIGGDKVAWVKDMFAQLDQYPRIKVAIWWSHQDFDPDNKPARIYLLDETEQLVETFRDHLAPYKPFSAVKE